MNPNYVSIFFILSFTTSLVGAADQDTNRRILHQPLFPDTTPPPPSAQDLPDPADQPFFHELPNGPTTGQPHQSPPTPSSNSVAAAHGAPAPTKKVAIAVTSGILTLAVLSALALYLYRHRSKHPDAAQKLVGPNPLRPTDESRMPQSTFLYIGTVDPSTRTLAADETNGGSHASPYRKLNPGKRSERYRPSPDLQPLPPLPKQPPPAINSPPPMSSSDDESHDTAFYTPQGSSSMSNGSPSSNRNNHSNRLHHSKRSSPKSRLDTKPLIIPSIKQLPPPPAPPPPPGKSSLGPLQPSKSLSYTPKRTKFAAPPPPPDMSKLQSISNDDQPTPKIPIPPPPPPAAASKPLIPKKIGFTEPNTPSPVSKQPTMSSTPIPNPSDSPEKADRDDKDGSKPKLKALHWDKVRATSERATVWDQLKSSSFQLNEDAMESLFGCNPTDSAAEPGNTKPGLAAPKQENRVLDPKKSQNIAILIRALNVTREEVSEALLDGNPEGLGSELLETLVKMAPTKEEEIKLKDYTGETSKLGSAERFLKGILDIPFAFKRAEAMLYRANFDTEVAYLRKSFQTLEEASEELKNSRMFQKLLEAILRTGNRMNDGTNRGDARAFKLDTLLKLADVKGADGKTTLLHFVVQEIIRSEGSQSQSQSQSNIEFKQEEFRKQGLQVVSGLSKELSSIRKAAGMDSDVLSGYVSKLEKGLEKVRLVTQNDGDKHKFFDSMTLFLEEAVGEIERIKREEKEALLRVKEVTEYFHGDSAKEEAHPLRIFLIVRDFLVILDNVCRDVGRMKNGGATIGAGRSFRMPVNASLPVLGRYNGSFE